MAGWLVGSGATTVLVVVVLVWGRQRRQKSGLETYERVLGKGGDAKGVATIMHAAADDASLVRRVLRR